LLLSMFHFLEFFVTALFQPADVSYECESPTVLNVSHCAMLMLLFAGAQRS